MYGGNLELSATDEKQDVETIPAAKEESKEEQIQFSEEVKQGLIVSILKTTGRAYSSLPAAQRK